MAKIKEREAIYKKMIAKKTEEKKESKLLSDVKSNWKFFVLLFLAGVFYADFQSIIKDVDTNRRRQDTKIKDINKNADDLKKIQMHLEYERGYQDALLKCGKII